MYNYKARIYSPTLGRFMQTDPIGYGDGMNWYDYVGGDPVNGRDPSGLEDDGPPITVTARKKEPFRGSDAAPIKAVPSAVGKQLYDSVRDADEGYGNCPRVPSPGAGKAALDKNLAKARKRARARSAKERGSARSWLKIAISSLSPIAADLAFMIKTFKDGGDGDPAAAGPEYQDYGNFQYGATAEALGLPNVITEAGAELYAIIDTKKLDDQRDRNQIESGQQYAAKNCDTR